MRFLRGLSIQHKILSVLAVGMVGFLTYFSVNYVILNENKRSFQTAVDVYLPMLEVTDALYDEVSALRLAATDAAFNQSFDSLGKMDELNKAIEGRFEKWKELTKVDSTLVQDTQAQYRKTYGKVNEVLQNVVAGVEKLAKVQTEFKGSLAELSQIGEVVVSVNTKIENDLNAAVKKANNGAKKAIGFGFLVVFCAIGITCAFWYVMTLITSSLGGTNQSLQDTSRRLLDMVDEALVASNQLQATANRQSSSSTETVVSMEEMKRLLVQTSKAAQDALALSEANNHESNDGKTLISALRDAMVEIERSNSELEEVNNVVKLIREKTNVINEIVFKTQLLSFNANIEAARAGQHGLGFAVVATEMGSLAELSGRAAQEINELLDQSADAVGSTVERTKEKVQKGNDLSAKCYEFFNGLTTRSGQVKSMVNSISAAAAEQNTGVDYVVSAMNELSHTASETDRMARGVGTLSDALKAHALTLASAVDSLNKLIRGRGRPSAGGQGQYGQGSHAEVKPFRKTA